MRWASGWLSISPSSRNTSEYAAMLQQALSPVMRVSSPALVPGSRQHAQPDQLFTGWLIVFNKAAACSALAW